MKIKDNFIFQRIADEFLVVPIAEEATRVNGVIKLNEVGAFLWNLLIAGNVTETELVIKLVEEYHIDTCTATHDVKQFLDSLNSIGCLE